MSLAFLAPRYWGIWMLVGLMWAAARLPYGVQLLIGNALGVLLFVLAGRRRRIAKVNLGLCFPEHTCNERKRLLRAHFRSLGMAIVELGSTYWGSDSTLRRRVRPSGLEHIKDALSKGRGVILLGAHFTTMELGLRLLSLFQPCQIMYRKNNNPLLDYIILSGRSRHPGNVFPREDVRTLYRSLKRNLVVWYAPDQNYGRRFSVFVPFFGHPAATITTLSRFAARSGAAVVPFVQHRLPGLEGYEIVALPALENFPSGDEEADARRINEVLEEQVKRSPEQYLWVHRRFKTTPPGGENVYAQV